jgi:predicted ATPase/DNA-binding winged helix-turn-helix (wHTH) protein
MRATHSVQFAPFRLDLGAEQLWCGEEARPLTRKAFAALCYLVLHAGQLVTKDELLAAVWAVPYVSDMALAACIREIRRALDEQAQAPRFVETVRGRGYRFCAPVTVLPLTPERPAVRDLPPVAIYPTGLLVGREGEMAQLQRRWGQAQQGVRQVVFVTGEAGIGKTALVDAFVTQVGMTASVWVGRGQCIEQHGAGEAYLPLLEALGHLGRAPDGDRLIARLRQQAPTWLIHLPAFVEEEEYDSLQRRAGGVTRTRMLRELAEAVEVLTADRPLILVLEDLHWSDVSTLDWLAYVARRRDTARLLVLGTYRPVEAIIRAHAVHTVTQDLLLHGQGTEIVLTALSQDDVATYLVQRCGAEAVSATLVPLLYQRTDGHPLFLVTLVNELVRQDMLQEGANGWEWVGSLEAVTRGVPTSVRQLLSRQFEQLSPSVQALLKAASVAGVEFTAATVAAGLAYSVEAVEADCDALARRGQFVQARGVVDWPDGTATARYGFLHALYREIIYEQVPASLLVQWHRQIGLRLEAGYGAQAQEVAAELAEHFVRGRDIERAVSYLQMAGTQAMQRSAHHAALQHFTQALELLATLPDTPRRAQQEITLRIALGPALMAARGWAVPEVEQTYARARALCAQVGEMPQLFPALMGLSRFYLTHGPLLTARELGQQLYRLAQDEGTLPHRLEAHKAFGDTLFFLGEFVAARTHLEQGITLTDPTVERVQALRYGVAPGVRCLAVMANTLWCLGTPAQAMQRSQEALALAQAVDHPESLAMVHHFAALLHHRRREVRAVQAQADALLTLATAQGFPLYVGHGTCWRGWTLAVQGQEEAGTMQLHQGLAAVLATGQTMTRPFHLVLLAEAAGHAGQIETGLHLLAKALAAFEASGRADMLAEAYRLQGVLLLQQAVADATRAEACFQQALAIARHQQARSWELRAATGLSRLWLQQGKQHEARALLAPIYDWFTEGFETADLQEARALLEELGG